MERLEKAIRIVSDFAAELDIPSDNSKVFYEYNDVKYLEELLIEFRRLLGKEQEQALLSIHSLTEDQALEFDRLERICRSTSRVLLHYNVWDSLTLDKVKTVILASTVGVQALTKEVCSSSLIIIRFKGANKSISSRLQNSVIKQSRNPHLKLYQYLRKPSRKRRVWMCLFNLFKLLVIMRASR
jgi:hypothetical protein